MVIYYKNEEVKQMIINDVIDIDDCLLSNTVVEKTYFKKRYCLMTFCVEKTMIICGFKAKKVKAISFQLPKDDNELVINSLRNGVEYTTKTGISNIASVTIRKIGTNEIEINAEGE